MAQTENTSVTFTWKGVSSEGSPQSGVIVAESRTSAIIKLRKRDIRVVSFAQQSKPLLSFLSNRVKPTDITQVTKQLATTLSSGIPLAQSLALISVNNKNQPITDLLSQLQRNIESGYSFSQALSEHQTAFSSYYISLVETGESTGQLDNCNDSKGMNKT